MTCIVGVTFSYPLPGGVVMAADSFSGCDSHAISTTTPKVVYDQRLNMLVGFTSSWRMGQVIESSLGVIPSEAEVDLGETRRYIVGVVGRFRRALHDNGWAKSDDGQSRGGSFLIGYKGKIYEVGSDFGVVDQGRYGAVGSGYAFAMGAMHRSLTRSVLSTFDGTSTAYEGLSAARAHSPFVRAPFSFHNLSSDGDYSIASHTGDESQPFLWIPGNDQAAQATTGEPSYETFTASGTITAGDLVERIPGSSLVMRVSPRRFKENHSSTRYYEAIDSATDGSIVRVKRSY